MTMALPKGAPSTLGAAFAHINSLTSPSVDDLKIMVLLEAAGLALYENLASGTDNGDVAGLLMHNGREELAHAHRVAKAILAISGDESWASNIGNQEAASQFRQNGKEEADHGNRLIQAAALLGA